MNLTINIISGVLSAAFGWAGGRKSPFHSWMRDWLIAPLCAIVAFIFGVHSWWLFLVIPATGAACSTYWDFLFGYDNFWFHGFVIGLAAFPICIATGHWWIFGIRCIALAIWMGGWSALIKNPHLEEAGRYAPVGASIFLLC